MTSRLTAGMLVAALIRRTQGAGGHAAVLAKGDATSGTILAILAERGQASALVERTLGVDGYQWTATGPTLPEAESGQLADYLARRRRSDPDLWAIELDVADARAILEAVAG